MHLDKLFHFMQLSSFGSRRAQRGKTVYSLFPFQFSQTSIEWHKLSSVQQCPNNLQGFTLQGWKAIPKPSSLWHFCSHAEALWGSPSWKWTNRMILEQHSDSWNRGETFDLQIYLPACWTAAEHLAGCELTFHFCVSDKRVHADSSVGENTV